MARKQIVTLGIAAVVLTGLVIGGAVWWRHKQTYETTDNAFVQAETVTVTSQIEGYVAEVLVRDDQSVKAGEVLVQLDITDVKARLEQALAQVRAANAAIQGVDDKAALEVAMITERQANITSAEAAAERARLEHARYGKLAEQGWASDQKLQDTRAVAAQTSAAVAQARAALEAEKRVAGSLSAARDQTKAEAAAIAAAEKANADLERALVRAPVSGVIGARAVRPGQYVRPGGAMMAIVPLHDVYVLANFKETQLARLRVGQSVTLKLDAFGGKAIQGRVESLAPATGSEFALIPVENAVGNFTKIAQRLPVRIAINKSDLPEGVLRPGLSVKVSVRVKPEPQAAKPQSR